MSIKEQVSRAEIICIANNRAYPLKPSDNFIGRARDNDIVLRTDTSLSRRHAVIQRSADAFYLRDLNSSNGTLINGQLVNGTVELRQGDEIFIGRSKFLFALNRGNTYSPGFVEVVAKIVHCGELLTRHLEGLRFPV